MPHLCGIEKAHRRRRVVERGQKIGFDVIDLCCGCPQAVQNIGNVHLVQLAEPLLDDLDGDLVFSQTDQAQTGKDSLQAAASTDLVFSSLV